jgi:SAM-dependent methyltransferase
MITDEQVTQIEALLPGNENHYMAKFCRRPRAWYAEAMEIAGRLGLHRSKPLRVLDIGCGFGYFAAACQELGHAGTGLDVRDVMIARAARILDALYIQHRITHPFPLPEVILSDTSRRYDLITMFGVNLKSATGVYWGEPAYICLARDVRKSTLPGGRWILRPNQSEDKTSPIACLSDAIWWQRVLGPEATVTVNLPEVEIRWT